MNAFFMRMGEIEIPEATGIPWLELLVQVLVWIGALLFFLAICGTVFWLVGIPFRRRQRALVVVQLIETGLACGRSPESVLRRAAESRDPGLGVRFHLLAGWLERGLTLSEALTKVPGLLPPRVTTLLKVGGTMGAPGKVLPACRAELELVPAGLRDWRNRLWLELLFLWPVQLFFLWTFLIFVLPKIDEIYKDMGDGAVGLPVVLKLAEAWFPYLVWGELILLVLVLGSFGAKAGASFAPVPDGWRRRCEPLLRAHAAGRDWLRWQVPWLRKRLERDFSALLAVLLDSGIPEERAVMLAAEGTGSGRIQARAAEVVAELRRGVKLTDAVAAMDDTGEFGWRLANAAAGPSQFVAALTGWHETLDARAFRTESAVAQVAHAGGLLVNGLFVGALAVGIFQALVAMMNMADGLW